MSALMLATLLTLGVSFFCSTLEAIILSATTADIEALKLRKKALGERLERFKNQLDETISAILTLNTIANTFGAFVCGVLAAEVFPNHQYLFAALLSVGILLISEILPKNIGVRYRPQLLPCVVYPIFCIRLVMKPFSFLSGKLVRCLLKPPAADPEQAEREIVLLAKKSAQEGSLSDDESRLIANTLQLDDVDVGQLMTPRTVVTALEKARTVGDVFAQFPNIPFARIPVYEENVDHLVGLVRRRDLLKAKANDQDKTTVADLMQPVVFVPENGTAATTLQTFLKNQQQLAVVVDEFGSFTGVVTMEDIFEHLLGREIFEKDDMAVDMRELARQKYIAARKREKDAPTAP